MVEFSLADGITNFLHTFMKPPESMVPIGYAYEMQCNAESVSSSAMMELLKFIVCSLNICFGL